MPKTITGQFATSLNGTIPGSPPYYLILQLNQNANAPNVALVTAQIPIKINLGNTATIPANTVIFANDELVPNTTQYVGKVLDSVNNLMWQSTFAITGNSPINLTMLLVT